jgi:hypothetical protein
MDTSGVLKKYRQRHVAEDGAEFFASHIGLGMSLDSRREASTVNTEKLKVGGVRFQSLLDICIAIILLVLLRYGLHLAFHSDEWCVGDWLINYHAGFVRRGLAGEGILDVAHWLHIRPPLDCSPYSTFLLLRHPADISPVDSQFQQKNLDIDVDDLSGDSRFSVNGPSGRISKGTALPCLARNTAFPAPVSDNIRRMVNCLSLRCAAGHHSFKRSSRTLRAVLFGCSLNCQRKLATKFANCCLASNPCVYGDAVLGKIYR